MSSKEPHIRPKILRRYYEDTWNEGGYTADTFAGATFEEFFAICRLNFPGTTPRRAAANSGIPRFRSLEAELPADPPAQAPKLRRTTHLARQPAVDLSAQGIPGDTESLVIDRIAKTLNWEALRGLSELKRVSCILVEAASPSWQGDRLQLEELNLNECGRPLENFMLSMCSSRHITLDSRAAWPKLGAVRRHSSLCSLSISAPIVRDVAQLQGLALGRLILGNVEPDESLFATLKNMSKSLTHVRIFTTAPFAPERLPSSLALRELSVTGHLDYRKEWIDHAVSHPECCFLFPSPASRQPTIRLAEIYRGVDILRVRRGKKLEFCVETDLASFLADFDGSNGDLEDLLKPRSKEAPSPIRWGSEADTLVAFSKDIASCRWVVDAALGENIAITAPS